MTNIKLYRINYEIKSRRVRLIGNANESFGVLTLNDAINISKKRKLDLVEVAPKANPPVCRLLDYGKFKYYSRKKKHEIKINNKIFITKEIKFRPNTDYSDYCIKLRNIFRFLEEGNKVKITLRFRGREMSNKKTGTAILDRIYKDLIDVAQIDTPPLKEGKQISVVLNLK